MTCNQRPVEGTPLAFPMFHATCSIACRSARPVVRWLTGTLLALCWVAPTLAQPLPSPQESRGPATGPSTAPALGTPVVSQQAGSAEQAVSSIGAITPEQKRLVDEGLALRGQARDREALERFERAYEAGHDARILAQIAFAEQALGRWVASYRHLDQALSEAEHPWIARNRELLRTELDKIAGNLVRLEILVDTEDAQVYVDGVPVGKSPLADPIVVAPGAINVTVEKEGYLRGMRQVLAVRTRGLARTEIRLVPAPASPIPGGSGERHATVTRERGRPIWLYVAGAGAVVAASAVVPWVLAENKTEALLRECDPEGDPCSDARFASGSGAVDDLDLATNALLFGGLGVAAVSLATYLLWREEYDETIEVSGIAAPDGAALMTRVRF
ncbi:MAG: PEGA domain-containing protein [Myxococcales bacterium]|nr:PEGA domain-containing protein [Myxococcales bacterium]